MEGNLLEIRVDEAIDTDGLGKIIVSIREKAGGQVALSVACSPGLTKFLFPGGDRSLRETVVKVLGEQGYGGGCLRKG